MQAYMKSSMPYRGVQLPAVRAICRELFAAHPLGSKAAWRAAVHELWYAAQYREERYAAIELLGARRYAAFRTLDVLPLYAELISNGAWWDLVDAISHLVGELLRQHGQALHPTLLAWSRGDDLWLRRSAIICQVGLKERTDGKLLMACIAPSLGQPGRDFFIRKAIGWALRDYAKVAPEAVRSYVAAHAHELSGLSRREALKHVG
jgi:3-methyladenine DNA glycosylase AlkD